MSIFSPHCDGSLLHEPVHLAQNLVPIALRPLIPFNVKANSVEMFSHCSFIQHFSDMISTLFVSSFLLMRSEELEIACKGLFKESFSHSFNHHCGSGFLALCEVANASPAPDCYRKCSVKQLPECFINSSSLACPVSLCLYP